ncbi:CDP-alcohol phosphatidyltransferase family protein [Leifsonia sp. McL0607]|uniref:CDP-alcohol phosphatidyltransferase family protein n=1 Tax=Leifsonia sp. McL0607 TaxID=3415672 RepID=UPI003CEFAB4E
MKQGTDVDRGAGSLWSEFGDQWLLLPNLVTYLRGLLLPVFVVMLALDAYGWALAALAIIGLSDWVDGFLARRLGLVSRLGQCLDPLFDRVGVIVIVVSCAAVGLAPWWLVAVLVSPELVLGCLLRVRPQARRIVQPTRIGKVRTALLLVGFPLLILAAPHALDSATLTATAGSLLALGAVGHLVAGVQYGRALLAADEAGQVSRPAP